MKSLLKQLVLLGLLLSCALSQMGTTTINVGTDPTNVDVESNFVTPYFPIVTNAVAGSYAAVKIKIPVSGGSSVAELTLTLYEENAGTSTDVSTLCDNPTDTLLCSFVVQLPTATGDYYLLVSKTVVWGERVKIELFYATIDLFTSLANLNAATTATSVTYVDVIRD